MKSPDRARRERVSTLAGGDSGVHAVQMLGAQLDQTDGPKVRLEVQAHDVAVEHDRLGLEGVLAREPGIEVLANADAGDVDVDHQSAHGLLKGALGGGPCRETRLARLHSPARAVSAVLQHPLPRALAPVRRKGAVLVARAGSRVALGNGAVLHRWTWTSSRSGALGMRMSLPSRSTGVGHLPRRMSS